MPARPIAFAAALVALACAAAQAAEELKGIEVAQEKVAIGSSAAKLARERGKTESQVIRVTVPGRFRAAFCDGWGDDKSFPSGLGGFFDLVNDPDGKYDYAPPLNGGLLRTALEVSPRRDQPDNPHPYVISHGQGTLELLEANPVRVVVRHTWEARSYGQPWQPLNPDLQGQQTFAVYAPNRIYQTLTVIGTGEEVTVTENFTLHTSHAKWSGGKMAEHGAWSIPGPWTFLPEAGRGPKNYILHAPQPGTVTHEDGTVSRHPAGFLLVAWEEHATDYSGNRGNKWMGYRTGFSQPPKRTLTKGQRIDLVHTMLVVDAGITGHDKAAPYVAEYRTPGVPKFRKGSSVGDGYDEAMGSYTMKADAGGVDFDLPVDARDPVFEIADWPGEAPATITVGEQVRKAPTDYLAHAEKGRLLLQVRNAVAAGTPIVATRMAAGN